MSWRKSGEFIYIDKIGKDKGVRMIRQWKQSTVYIGIMLVLMGLSIAAHALPRTVLLESVIKKDGTPLNGRYNVQLTLLNGDTSVFVENHPSVNFVSGKVKLEIGSIVSLNTAMLDSDNPRLVMSIAGAGADADLISIPILSQFYALKAKEADRLSVQSVLVLTEGGGTLPINWTSRNRQKITLTSGKTVTFTNPESPETLTLLIVHGNANEKIINWPVSVKWANGNAAPELSQESGVTDIISFYFDGTTYYGTFTGGF